MHVFVHVCIHILQQLVEEKSRLLVLKEEAKSSQFDFCVCVCVCACIMHSYVVYTSRVLLLALQAGRGVYTCR